jgi:hypothetical protein
VNRCLNKQFHAKQKNQFYCENETNTMNNVNIDISQKSSMSLILYLFCNLNLLKLFEQSLRKMIVINF